MKKISIILYSCLLSFSSYGSCNQNEIRDDIKKIVKTYVSPSSRHPLRSVLYRLDQNELGSPLIDWRSTELERVASSQKIVTAYLLYKYKNRVSYPVSMSSGAHRIAKQGENRDNWNRYISGKKLNTQDLFRAILNLSSNGASFRALEIISRSSSERSHANFINNFIDRIFPGNRTNFTNAHGLDNYSYTAGLQKNFTTARDMSKIAKVIYSDAGYIKYLKKLGFYDQFFSKSGSTRAAGKNDIIHVTMKRRIHNCRGEKFILFYSGQSYTNAKLSLVKYFGHSSRGMPVEFE